VREIQVDGVKLIAADATDGNTCEHCVFLLANGPCPVDKRNLPVCGAEGFILTPENYIKLKLKGEVL